MSLKLSLIDLSSVPYEGTRSQAYKNTIETAKHIEELGYHRIWLAEHHNTRNLAGRAPEVIIPVVAAATSKIRVGSGAVLLNHYSPYKVAELFGTMEELFPGRIDLGIGRATTGPYADLALQRNRSFRQMTNDSMEQLKELLSWYDGNAYGGEHPFSQVHLFRDAPAPKAYLLGSSSWSAQAAAELGLPYVFASFINPSQTFQNIQIYKGNFKKSLHVQGIEEPKMILALNVYCQDTEKDALAFSAPVRWMMMQMRKGDINSPVLSEAEATEILDKDKKAARLLNPKDLPYHFTGAPEILKNELKEVAKFYEIDEIMIQMLSANHKRRMYSLELLAKALL
ncbi:MAG TPA: MsnO8 family LLM class oxidoreductase [Chitinophagaceae bacterium]|nr:MsnO8 family LLM class oxidoreductase [Chitinophagaceae bacterium]